MAPRNDEWTTPFVTKRLETLAVRSNVLAGMDPVKIQECTNLSSEKKALAKKPCNGCAGVGESVWRWYHR